MWFLAVGAAGVVDVFGDRRRADEADRLDAGVGEDRVDRHLVALDHVKHAVGKAGLLVEVRQAQGEGGVLFRGLQDETIAAGDREGRHPKRNHGREVERGDAGHHAEGLAHGIAVDAAADVLGKLALEEMGNAAGELDHLQAAGDRALGVVHRLAVFFGDRGRQLVHVLLDEALEAEHDPRAPKRRRRGPSGKRSVRRADRGIELALVGEGDPPDQLAQGRIEDIAMAPAGALDHLAADKMIDRFHRQSLSLLPRITVFVANYTLASRGSTAREAGPIRMSE
jgi:hypothetical protein